MEPPVPVLSRAEYATLREEIIQHASSYASYDGTFTPEEYADAMLKNMAVENDEVSNISVTAVWLRRQCHFFSPVILKHFSQTSGDAHGWNSNTSTSDSSESSESSDSNKDNLKKFLARIKKWITAATSTRTPTVTNEEDTKRWSEPDPYSFLEI
jgi:hypothetical protein